MNNETNNPTPGYVLVLTESQLSFIKWAIETFEEDYGISQEDMKAEIANLSDKVKQLQP
jgi:hypothetical protein